MKVALVHDYLREYGGAERVMEAMHELYPEAPLYTSFVDWNALGEHAERFKSWDIRTSWVQGNWLVKKFHSPLRFLTPLIWESLDLRGYDVIISSSGWYICRGILTQPSQLHISYIHHPPRNLYGYATGSRPRLLVRVYAALINPWLRMYDFATAQRVDVLVANSDETRRRIEKFYRREAHVIYPPVITDTPITQQKRSYFLSVGRLTYAKQIDVVIKACNTLQLPLKIVGVGKEEEYLRSIAGPTVTFEGSVNDAELVTYYQGARALIFCALDEDFGMVPVEAMAAGTPVIALRQGGVRETVIDGKTGLFFDLPTAASLQTSLGKFERLKFQAADCQTQAARFSKDHFMHEFSSFVNKTWETHKKTLLLDQTNLR
jgi:glycosyltransferase involved in cell wall biosynthesis